MLNAPQHTYILLTKRPQNIWSDFAPPVNWWLGVTCENQTRAYERWNILRNLDVRFLFVSVEPMLGPVTFSGWNEECDRPDWVICGPETGPGARPCDPAWIDQLSRESPCFFDKCTAFTRREWPRVTENRQ